MRPVSVCLSGAHQNVSVINPISQNMIPLDGMSSLSSFSLWFLFFNCSQVAVRGRHNGNYSSFFEIFKASAWIHMNRRPLQPWSNDAKKKKTSDSEAKTARFSMLPTNFPGLCDNTLSLNGANLLQICSWSPFAAVFDFVCRRSPFSLKCSRGNRIYRGYF